MNIIDSSIYDNLELLPIDLQGWHGDSLVFPALIKQTRPKLIIEVGTWKGQSAINMAKCIKQDNLSCKIICVDTWLGALEFWDYLKHTPERNLMLKNGYPQIYYQFLSNVVHCQVQDIIQPFPTTSNIAASYFAKHSIKADLIYLDGSHEYKDVCSDIENYKPILAQNGILFGDDYFNFKGVYDAVNELLPQQYRILESNFWIYQKC